MHPEQEGDRVLWARVAGVLARARARARRAGGEVVRDTARDKEEVVVLTQAMEICFDHLDNAHVQFNEALGRAAKRRGLLGHCTVT